MTSQREQEIQGEIEILAMAIRDTLQGEVATQMLYGEKIANWSLARFAGEMARRNEELIPLLREHQQSIVEPLDNPLWMPGDQ